MGRATRAGQAVGDAGKAAEGFAKMLEELRQWMKDGETELHAAVRSENVSVLRHLLENGADPNVEDRKGHTPLYYASQ